MMRLVRQGASVGIAVLLVTILAIPMACTTTTHSESQPEQDNKARVARTNTELGMGYLQQGERRLAIEKLQKAIATDPDYAPAQHAIALAYQEFGQMELAEKHYRAALKLLPTDGALRNNFGAFLCGLNRSAESEEHFRSALRDPTYTTPQVALENAGLCALNVSEYEKAEQYLRQALKVDADLKGALLGMARLQLARNQHLSARGYLQRYESVAALPAQGLLVGVQVERRLGDASAVQRYVTRLKGEYPDSVEAQQLQELEAGLIK